MKITVNNLAQTNRNISYKSTIYNKNVINTYKSLDSDILKSLVNQGVTKGLIMAILDRLSFNPKFVTMSKDEILKILLSKIKIAIELFQNGKKAEDISKELKLAEKPIRGFVNIRTRLLRDKDIINLYKNGFSIKSLTKEYNLSSRAITLILAKVGISPEKNAEEKRNKIITLVKNGQTDESISELLGVTTKYVCSIRSHNRLHKNKSHKPNNFEQTIIDLLKSDIKREQISKKLNLSIHRINHISKKFGVKRDILNKRNEEISKRIANGISAKEVAREFNIDVTTVYRIINK